MLRTFRKVIASGLTLPRKMGWYNGSSRIVFNANGDFNTANRDFTIQLKFNPAQVASGNAQRLYTSYNTNINSVNVCIYVMAGRVYAILAGNDLEDSNGGKVIVQCTNNLIQANKKQDICFERVGNSFQLYVNGMASKEPVIAAITQPNVNYPLYIGARYYAPTTVNTEYPTGIIDDVRLINGASRWKGPFTPPDQIINPGDQWWAQTQLALRFDDGFVDLKGHALTNYGVTLQDYVDDYAGQITDPAYSFNSALFHFTGTPGTNVVTDIMGKSTFTAFGNAKLLSYAMGAQSSALAFDMVAGSAYHSGAVASNGPLDLATGVPDFTISLRINPTIYPGAGDYNQSYIFCWGGGYGAGYEPICIQLSNTGKVSFGWNSANSATNVNWITSTSTIPLNAGTDIEVVKIGSKYMLFVNGVLEATKVSAVNPYYWGNAWSLGQGLNNTYKYCGWVEKLRITKSVGRHYATYSPATDNY